MSHQQVVVCDCSPIYDERRTACRQRFVRDQGDTGSVRIVRPAKPARRYVAELLVPFRFADKRVSRNKGGTVPGHFALTPVTPMPYRSASERGNEGTAPQLAK